MLVDKQLLCISSAGAVHLPWQEAAVDATCQWLKPEAEELEA